MATRAGSLILIGGIAGGLVASAASAAPLAFTDTLATPSPAVGRPGPGFPPGFRLGDVPLAFLQTAPVATPIAAVASAPVAPPVAAVPPAPPVPPSVAPSVPPIPATTLGTFVVTCYDDHGQTASGAMTSSETVAVDPSVIPLGSIITISGVGPRVAEDTGGAIKGKRLDIWEPSASECIAWGRQSREVSRWPSSA